MCLVCCCSRRFDRHPWLRLLVHFIWRKTKVVLVKVVSWISDYFPIRIYICVMKLMVCVYEYHSGKTYNYLPPKQPNEPKARLNPNNRAAHDSTDISISLSLYIYIYIYMFFIGLLVHFMFWVDFPHLPGPKPNVLRPTFKLRIYNFGIWVKHILKQRRWAFLVHCLIS